MNLVKFGLVIVFLLAGSIEALSLEISSDSGVPKTIPGKTSIALGMQRYTTVSGDHAFTDNTIHGMIGVSQGMWLGMGFGMDKNFRQALIEGDLRLNVAVYKEAALFINIMAGYKRVGYALIDLSTNTVVLNKSKNCFTGAGLFGFDFPIVGPKLRASLAYGMHFLTGFKENNVGITNNDFVGNFGIHWYF